MSYTIKKGRISKRGCEVRIASRRDRVYDAAGKNIGVIVYDWEDIGEKNSPEDHPKYVSYWLYYFPRSGGDGVFIETDLLIPMSSPEGTKRIPEAELVERIVQARMA